MSLNRQQQIDAYIERLIQLRSVSFGDAGFTRMAINPTSSRQEVGSNLQQAAIAFKRACLSGNHEDTVERAGDIEGHIMVARTLNAITDTEADALIDQLYNIVEGK